MTRSPSFATFCPPAPSAWINSLESRINIGGGRRLRQRRTLSQGEDICLFLACGHTVWMHVFLRVITFIYHEGELHKIRVLQFYICSLCCMCGHLPTPMNNTGKSVARDFLAMYQRRGQPVRSVRLTSVRRPSSDRSEWSEGAYSARES